MTCKYLYLHAGCNYPEWVIEKDGKKYYPLCDYSDLRGCPHYEDGN